MILVFEMVWTGTHHVPGNSVTIQTIAAAFPHQAVRVHADPSHLAELRADPALAACRNVTLRPIAISSRFRFRPHLVSLRRGLRELATMAAALWRAPHSEPSLLMLLSATPTAVFAAALLARLSRRPVRVQVGLHGNLNDAIGWRSRHRLLRALDLPAALSTDFAGRLRFLVLEEAIRQAMARRFPVAAARCDVLPLPVNQAELAAWRPVPFAAPIRIGLVGQATEAKGISPFLALAERFRRSHPGRVEFHLVGRAMPGDDLTRFAPLASPVSDQHLPRAEFLARLAGLHFVCLPLQAGYYDLSASGALLDALTWLKPIIASDRPIVRDLFAQGGDIGYLCPDADAMAATIEAILNADDATRYARQCDALRILRAGRTPAALARRYEEMIAAGFPDLFPLATPSPI